MRRPYVKLCGLHSEEDVQLVQSSQADYIGFVMAKSKREVSPDEAASWLDRHPLPGKKVAALFVNATIEEMKKAVQRCPVDIIQLHGTESVETVQRVKDVTQKEVWKAFRHDEETLTQLELYRSYVDGFVIDAKVKGAWGGTGQTFDWKHVPEYVQFGKEHNLPLFIAGGITPDNVEELLRYEPWGIDLSSGIERNGKKDKEKLTALEKRLMMT